MSLPLPSLSMHGRMRLEAVSPVARKFSGVLAVAMLATLSCERSWLSTRYNEVRGDSYPLDPVERRVDGGVDGGVDCDTSELMVYSGDAVKLQPPAKVAAPFAKRLESFELAVQRVGDSIYGRGPSAMLHVGTYVCRTVEHRPNRKSEHALGNAIDVTGFRFPALETNADAGALPERLRDSFVASVRKHWNDEDGTEATRLHERFFAELAEAISDQNLFRGALGPADSRHQTHLHLDMAPWKHHRL